MSIHKKNHLNNNSSYERSLGYRIKFIRKILSLSQLEFAYKVGLESHVAVYRYEKNASNPSKLKAQRIVELGHTTMSWLYTGDVDESLCRNILLRSSFFGSSLKDVAESLGVNEKYMIALKEYKINPSYSVVENYCRYYNLSGKERIELLDSFDKSEYDPELVSFESGIKKVPERNEAINEIINLLVDDEEAQKIVLELVRTLKKRKTV